MTDTAIQPATVSQDAINAAVWNACDTFRGTVDPSIYKDFVLTMLFLKYVSDVWQDHYDAYKQQYGDHPELIEEMLKSERFVLPADTSFYAVCIDEPPGPSVCSPHFFHLQVASNAPLLPAFLAWQINQPPFQRQLQQAAEGSSQLSIRRPVLESLTLSVPSLADQHRIVALAELARAERRALSQLINNRERQLQALAEDLAQSAQASR